MKPLNVIQIGKKNTLNELKPSNTVKTVSLERAPPSIKVGQISPTVLFRKNIFFRNGTAQLVTVAHKKRKTNKVRGAIL